MSCLSHQPGPEEKDYILMAQLFNTRNFSNLLKAIHFKEVIITKNFPNKKIDVNSLLVFRIFCNCPPSPPKVLPLSSPDSGVTQPLGALRQSTTLGAFAPLINRLNLLFMSTQRQTSLCYRIDSNPNLNLMNFSSLFQTCLSVCFSYLNSPEMCYQFFMFILLGPPKVSGPPPHHWTP